MQLFCLTYAGGTAAFYDQLDRYMDSGIELIKLEYAGHGTRLKEPFYHDFGELAEDMHRQIAQRHDPSQEYALIGYSMGSIALVEVLKKTISAHEIPLPVRVFIAAHEPHSKIELEDYSDDELDEYVKQRTVRFGGIPEQLVNNRIFWRMYLPLFRNDYSMIGRYRFEDLTLKAEIPATVFYSETDTPLREMAGWEDIFVGEVEYYRYEGTHFFIQQHCPEICAVINDRLLAGGKK